MTNKARQPVMTNPLREDALLRKLLEQLDSLQTHREFGEWKGTFLDRLEDQYLDEAGLKAADRRYKQLGKYMTQLVRIVKQLEQLQGHGKLAAGNVSVKAHQAVGRLNETMRLATSQLQLLLPGTAEEVVSYGFSKFHMGAVLVRDHFGEYDRLYLCDQILQHLRLALASVVDHQVLDEMTRFGVQLENFCAIMADLGLYEAMVKCHQLKVDEIASASSDDDVILVLKNEQNKNQQWEEAEKQKTSKEKPITPAAQQPLRQPKILKTSADTDDEELHDKYEYDNISLSDHSIYSLKADEEKIAEDGDTSVSKLNHSFNSYYIGNPNDWRIAPKRNKDNTKEYNKDSSSVASSCTAVSKTSPRMSNKGNVVVSSTHRATTSPKKTRWTPKEEGSARTVSTTVDDGDDDGEEEEEEDRSKSHQRPRSRQKLVATKISAPSRESQDGPEDAGDNDNDDDRTMTSLSSSVCRSLRPGVMRGQSYMATPEKTAELRTTGSKHKHGSLGEHKERVAGWGKNVNKTKTSPKAEALSRETNPYCGDQSLPSTHRSFQSGGSGSIRPGVFRGDSCKHLSDDEGEPTRLPEPQEEEKDDAPTTCTTSLRPGMFRGGSFDGDSSDDDDTPAAKAAASSHSKQGERAPRRRGGKRPQDMRTNTSIANGDANSCVNNQSRKSPWKEGQLKTSKTAASSKEMASPVGKTGDHYSRERPLPRPKVKEFEVRLGKQGQNGTVNHTESRECNDHYQGRIATLDETPYSPESPVARPQAQTFGIRLASEQNEGMTTKHGTFQATYPDVAFPDRVMYSPGQLDDSIHEVPMPKPVIKKFEIGVARHPPKSPRGLGQHVFESDEEDNIACIDTDDTGDTDDENADSSYRRRFNKNKDLPDRGDTDDDNERGDPNLKRKGGIRKPTESGQVEEHGDGGESKNADDDNYQRRRMNKSKNLPDRGDTDDDETGRDPNLSRKGGIRRPGEDNDDGEKTVDDADGAFDDDDSEQRRRMNKNKHLPDRGDTDDEDAGRDPHLSRKGGIRRPGENDEDVETSVAGGDLDDDSYRRRMNKNKHLPDRGDTDDEDAGRDPNLSRKGGIRRPGEDYEDDKGSVNDADGDLDDDSYRRRMNKNKHLPDRGDTDDEGEGRDPNLSRTGGIRRPGEGNVDGEKRVNDLDDDSDHRRRMSKNKHLPDRGDTDDEDTGRDPNLSRIGGIRRPGEDNIDGERGVTDADGDLDDDSEHRRRMNKNKKLPDRDDTDDEDAGLDPNLSRKGGIRRRGEDNIDGEKGFHETADDLDEDSDHRRRMNKNKHLPDRGDTDEEDAGRDPNLNRKGGIRRPGEDNEDGEQGIHDADGELDDDSYQRRRMNKNRHLPDRGDSDYKDAGRDSNLSRKGGMLRPGEDNIDVEKSVKDDDGDSDDDSYQRRRMNRNKHLPDRGDTDDEDAERDHNLSRKGGVRRGGAIRDDDNVDGANNSEPGEGEKGDDVFDDSHHRRRMSKNKNLPDRGDTDDDEAKENGTNLNRKGGILRGGEPEDGSGDPAYADNQQNKAAGAGESDDDKDSEDDRRKTARHRSAILDYNLEEANYKREKCYMWYARLGQPNREKMKKLVMTLPPSCEILVDDVDLLPWILGGLTCDVRKMTELIANDLELIAEQIQQ